MHIASLGALALAVALTGCLAAAQKPSPRAPVFDGRRALDHTAAVVAFGPRPAGSPALEKTRHYIRQQLEKLGLRAEDQAFEAATPAGALPMVNVRTAIGGTLTDRRLLIGGHYDTKRLPGESFVGANDAGSSTGFLLEVARALTQAPPPMPVELVFFDGEESVRRDWVDPDNRYGSRHYVTEARNAGALGQIGALILVDMIGDADLTIKRELQSTRWLTEVIWAAAARLGRKQFVDEATAVEDDHIPFLEAGVPAVDLIDFDYPAWHTAGDTMDKLDARSFQVVGEVVLASLPDVARRVAGPAR